ncbi:MAG TPA: hypothetical protein VG034_15345, partial [Acidimicrobiia bacterium]|nr:hypothetical protein [Acidimicrobiia bacterium]
MYARKMLPVLFVVAFSGAWTTAAQAQTAADQPRRSCPKDAGSDCCDPGAQANTDDEEPAPAADCPGGRSHRRGADGSGDTPGDDNDNLGDGNGTPGDDNDTGPASGTFRSG